MKCLVLDFGGTFLKYGLMDENAVLTEQGEMPSPNRSAEEFREAAGSLYDRFRDEIEGIAISMPGFLDIDTGYAESAGAFLSLYGVNIYDLLKERCPVPTILENDGKCAALAEAWQGNLKDCRDGAALILGTGVGGGIIKDGVLHRGAHFGAGEFSYILTGDTGTILDSAFMNCGVAALVIKAALLKGADMGELGYFAGSIKGSPLEKLGETAVGPKYPDMKMDGFQIFKLLEEGDPDIVKLYEAYVDSLSVLCLNVAAVYNPDRIVLGGGVSKEPRLIRDLQDACARLPQKMAGMKFQDLDIQPCRFRSAANLYGAMYNYLLHRASLGVR